METLKEIHGDGLCHICGKPRAEPGSVYCSYPHAMVPHQQVGETDMWTWKAPSETSR